MASPSNPFDGLDNYSAVANHPPQPNGPQQPPVSPNQWAQQPAQQQAVQQRMAPPGSPAAAVGGAANPFAPSSGNPFGLSSGAGGLAPPSAPAVAGVTQQPTLAYPQQPQQQQQQLVPLAPNAVVQSPWALQPAAGIAPMSNTPATVLPAAGGQQFDPLAIFGASPTQPQQAQTQQLVQNSQQQQQQQQMQQPQFQPQQQYSGPDSPQMKLQEEVQQFKPERPSILPGESEDEGLALIDVELDDDDTDVETRKQDGEFLESTAVRSPEKPKNNRKGGGGGGASRQRNSWDRNADIAPPPPVTSGRNHAEFLAQNSAPALSSPLPKPELVHHSGYVLSRISFRTVLMRKWKQTFWIQYGPTQLLFFRSFADYEDWVNNPYHTQKAREFLVKLRVDFVADLKKSSVMGYQVTQVRRKPYGKNVMLHFKLERWMDYGPTIAAAFAAREEEMMNSPSHRRNGNDEDGMNTSNDVSSLRKIILGCMRNARDAALVAASRAKERTDMGEAVGYRGRYDSEHQREVRIPSGDRNMGYHQAFSAESSGRRRVERGEVARDQSPSTESSQEDENNTNTAPVVDLLG